MKKFLAIVLASLMCLSLFGCGEGPGTDDPANGDKVKVGFIYIGDENSTYDLNFMTAAKAACEAAGFEYMEKTNVGESNAAYEAALDLIDHGCTVIFANSFGQEPFIIQAAKENPDIIFAHASGNQAHTAGAANYHNAFAAIYNARYLAGVAAGLKMKEQIDNGEYTAEEALVGYVGAYTFAEVISGYTAFLLGIQSIVPEATMEVMFTGSWGDETKEREAAKKLLADGCKIISQHADTFGAPTACEDAGIPNVAYNGSTISACPNTYLTASYINWRPYFDYLFKCVKDGTEVKVDYAPSFDLHAVELCEINEKCAAAGTKEKLESIRMQLISGEIHVFDTSKFTVTVTDTKNQNAKVDENGHLVEYMADVDYDDAYTPDSQVVAQGYFHESEWRSAPYFDVQIDGITLLNTAF